MGTSGLPFVSCSGRTKTKTRWLNKKKSSQDLKKSYKKKHPTRKGTRKWKLKKLCKNFGIAQAEKFDKRWDKRWQMPVDEAKKIWNEHKKKPGDSNQDHS